MWTLIPVLLSLGVASVMYFLAQLRRKRNEMVGLPQPPMRNRLLGHLVIAEECRRLFPPEIHPQAWLRYIQKKYGLGDIFYLDWWPLGPRWLCIADPELVSQYVTTTQSLPKSSLTTDFLDELLGANNMISLEGQRWKSLRSIFNPGFSASHLMTLVPHILDTALVFRDVLSRKAKSGELVQLEEFATKLTLDIIGKVVLDSDLGSQKAVHPIFRCFRERVRYMPVSNGVLDLTKFEIWRRFKLWRNGIELDRLIGNEVDRKMASRELATTSTAQPTMKERKRSVIDLALDAYHKERLDMDKKQILVDGHITKNFRRNAIDSMKTFIFAGYDTTASTLAYVFYLLHFHPKVHRTMIKEFTSLFGPSYTSQSIAQAIRDNPHVINRMEYTNAVIKETLRLFPPASTLRYSPRDANLYMTEPKTGQQLPLSGFVIWPAVTFIARNEAFFPRPTEFIPERFIPSLTPFPDAKLFTPAGKDAWRPFEKGPRNCIGQELAMIEARIVLALTATDLDFVAEFDGTKVERLVPVETCDEYRDGVEGRIRRTVEGHRCYQVLKSGAKPRDGMPGRMVSRNSGKEEQI